MSTPPATVEAFKHCGGCGASDIKHDGFAVRCEQCGWTFFTNVAAAAAVFLRIGDKVLLVRRGREPSKGKLGIPGGFVDPGESAAQGACREVEEELRIKLTPDDLTYLTTAPNVYPYAGVTYRSLDTYFTATLDALPEWFDESEISAIELVDPFGVEPEDLAFDATRAGIEALKRFSRDPAG